MRILITVHGYPPGQQGGAERRAERTARAMRERGHEVAVLAIESDNAPHAEVRVQERIHDGVRVREVAFNGGANDDPLRYSYDHPDLGMIASNFMDQYKPQLMHLFSGYLWGASALDAATAHGVRTIVDLTDYWWLCHQINLLTPLGERCDEPSAARCARCYAERQRRFRIPARLVPKATSFAWDRLQPTSSLGRLLGLPAQEARAQRLQRALATVDRLLAPSRFLADFYGHHGIDKAKITVARQGVELKQCVVRKPSTTLRVGYIGQVKPHKGVDLLLDAWKLLTGPRPRKLAIYGADAGHQHYGQHLVETLGDLPDAAWHGTFAGAEVWDVLADLDVVVIPSRWVENSPNSILEAQAVGVAVVGSNLGGIAELIEHEKNGLLFQVDDAEDLAKNLQRLLDEPELLPRLRTNPLPFRSHGAVMDDLEQIYHSTLTGASMAGRSLLQRVVR
ncbi:MAG: glycosyltransferase [Candidatus Viridilinea halotolerans]|uniref:Glycosyltransferase n=1 Tax=Candidatus Viridilinea halotolerans TaxID=2491704 RepID=A0A426U7P4_9CHLR|nr:MAG: glycosyltransferase [Candidatus Viridilinea halotolerans]